jgi:hypothetical protein
MTQAVTLKPDPHSVRELAFLIASMPTVECAGATFRRVLQKIHAGALAKGWSHQVAADYASVFGDAIVAAIHAMPCPSIRVH